MEVEVRRAADRFTTTAPGRVTRHSFSFGEHYDPRNLGHGLLVAHNDDRLDPGAGYPEHPHRDVEILTWVVSGTLTHEDSAGRRTQVGPGTVQRVTAGTGIRHSERNEGGEPVRFVQAWLRAEEASPEYARADLRDRVRGGGLVPLVSGLPGTAAPVPLRVPAALHVAVLATGAGAELPGAPYLHVFVARGAVDLGGAGALAEGGAGALAEGDAARLTDAGPLLTTATEPTELLVWQMHPGTPIRPNPARSADPGSSGRIGVRGGGRRG